MTKGYDMEDSRMKEIDFRKDFDLNQILEQLETFERVYPYYVNMLQDHTTDEPSHNPPLKSTMKHEE